MSSVPCRAVPCRAVPCRAVPCRAVPCRAVPCRASAKTRQAKSHHITSYYTYYTWAVASRAIERKWLRGRASDSRLREPGCESYAAGLKHWASVITLHWSCSHSCINEYLAIVIGGYVYEQPSRINWSIWLDASQRSWYGVWVNRSASEVKCKALWTVLMTGYCVI